MTTPTLTYTTGTGTYRSLWLRYITAVDLDVHCINSLHGTRHRPLEHTNPTATLTLTQDPTAQFIYFCAVSNPYRWKNNGHLLAEITPGTPAITYQTSTLELELTNLTPLTIHPHAIDPDHPHANDRLYNTCRNWQAAWILHNEHGLPNRPNPDRFKHRRPVRKEPKSLTLF